MIERKLIYQDKNKFSIFRAPAGMGEWDYIVMYKDAYVCTTDKEDKAKLIAATFLLTGAQVKAGCDGSAQIIY